MNFVTPRKVTKSVYNTYTDADYNSFSTNLNPLNPTTLETQYNNMVSEVRYKLKEIYIQNNLSTDKEVFNIDIPSLESVQDALDDIMNKMQLAENPLYEMMQEGLPINAALTTQMEWINNPFVLDCNGIETPTVPGSIKPLTPEKNSEDGEDSSDDSTSDEDGNVVWDTDGQGDGSESSSGNDIVYTITYHNTEKLQKADWGPLEYTKDTKTLEFKNGTPLDVSYTFVGWYLDSLFSEKVPKNKLSNPRKNLQLYANVAKIESYNEGLGTAVVSGSKPIVGAGDNRCDVKEMEWLKIILMILKICKILVNVLILIYNVARAASEIAKDAQMCWINPPSMMSLINYVLQRVGAILFQIFGRLLLYLWSLLNLDCLSNRTMELINEINAILAGVSSTVDSVQSAAVQLSGGSLQAEWQKAMQELKQKVKDAKEEFKEQWSNIGSQLLGSFDETGLQQLKDAFVSDPWGFLADNVVPDKIKNQIMDLYDTMQTSKDVVNVLYGQMKTKNKDKQKKQGEDRKNVETQPV